MIPLREGTLSSPSSAASESYRKKRDPEEANQSEIAERASPVIHDE